MHRAHTGDSTGVPGTGGRVLHFWAPQVQNNLEREFLASYQAQGSAQTADRHVLRPPTEKANLLVLELQPEGQAPGLPHI